MPDLSVSISEIDAVVKQAALPIMLSAYRGATPFYSRVCTVVDNSQASHPYLGHRALDVIGPGQFQEIELGQELPATNMGNGYPRQGRIRKMGSKLGLPKEFFFASSWQADLIGRVRGLADTWGRNAMTGKDKFVAGMLLDGTLSAGSMTYFNNSFTGFPDSTAGKTYDGTAFFVASGKPITGASTTFTNLTVSRSLSSANLQTTLTTVESTNAIDERGEKIDVSSEFLVTGKDLEFTADTILNSAQVAGSANNDVNPLRGKLTSVATPHLTTAGAWWLLNRQNIVAIDSGEPVIEVVQVGELVEVRAVYYFGAYVQDWRGSYACNKAAS